MDREIDPLDVSARTTEEELERGIAAARGDIPPGIEGDCDMCGEWFGRLIGGACPPCRDKYGLK